MGASIGHVTTRWFDPPETPNGDPVPVLVSGGTILVTQAGLITVSADREIILRGDGDLDVDKEGRVVDSSAAGMPILTEITLDGTSHVMVTGTGGTARGHEITGGGSFSTWVTLEVGSQPLAIAATPATPASPGAGGDILAVSSLNAGGITLWSRAPSGALTQLETLSIGRDMGGEVRDLTFIDTPGGTVLVGVSLFAGEVVSWAIDGAGAAGPAQSYGAPEGLALAYGATLRALEVDGQDYVLVGGQGTSSISLLEVGAGGALSLVDQVNDSLTTRFQGVMVLETIEVGGRTYVLAGGGDDGLTLLELAPTADGTPRFHQIAQIEDSTAAALADPTALGLRDNGDGTVTAFVGSEDTGLSELLIDLGNPGQTRAAAAGGATVNGTGGDDHILGGAGDDRLFGADGDDVIRDGAGEDRLWGGAGADTFAIAPDGVNDVIQDFELGIDRLDLSAYERLYSINDFAVVARADGGVGLRYNGETLVIFSANGPLSPSDITDAMVSGLWHVDVNPFSDAPLYAVGDVSDDHLAGGMGDDQLFGSAGADRIEGGGGNDLIHGETEEGVYDRAAAQIVRLYQATLDRAPDRAGHDGWTEMLEAGAATLQQIADGFVLSAEFQSQYGGLSDADFITLLYQNVLGRAPDAAGLAGWSDLLANGTLGRNEVVLGFSESPEFIGLTEADALPFSRAGHRAEWSDDVYRLYRATLDRDPDVGGFLGWTDLLARTATYEQAVEGFIGSVEFQARYGALDDAGFVTLLYDTVLGRVPAAAEVTAWTDLMAGGRSRAQVVEGFAQSVEFRALTAPDLAAFMGALGAEDDRLIAGEGEDILFGGIGADTFVFDAFTAGTHVVADFEPWDRVEITTGYGGPTSYSDLSLMQVGEDAMVVAGDATVIFGNTDVAELTQDVFVFG